MPYPTYAEALQSLRRALLDIYDAGEAAAIARAALLEVTGISYAQSLHGANTDLDDVQCAAIASFKEKLLRGMPYQYVAGRAHFYGRDFRVDSSVLIPRPETEELVAWITEDLHGVQTGKIVDVGTGSGCIAVSLKAVLDKAEITAVDLNDAALRIAAKNAAANAVRIDFRQIDFLDKESRESLGAFEVVVSNPPYIPSSEEKMLASNVRDWEPRLALFVPDNDPLIFYRALADFGQSNLTKHGAVYCELHKDFGQKASLLFREAGFKNVSLRKDMAGNDRMLRAKRQ